MSVISREGEWIKLYKEGGQMLQEALNTLEKFAELTSDWPMSETMPAPFYKAYNELALYHQRWQRMPYPFQRSA